MRITKEGREIHRFCFSEFINREKENLAFKHAGSMGDKNS